MTVGDRVIILSHSEYRNAYEGCVGVVEQIFNRGSNKKNDMYGVKLDDKRNVSSAKGVFWFSNRSLEYESTENIESEEMSIMFNNYKTVDVEFIPVRNGKEIVTYAYYPEDFNGREIKEGDTVVCATIHHGAQTAKIVKVYTAEDSNIPVPAHKREIVGFADYKAYYNRRVTEDKLSKLKAQMDDAIMQIQREAVYEMFAEKSPELKEMLEEYKRIAGECK